MKFIPTTTSRVNSLKKLAKQTKLLHGIKLSEALAREARAAGYDDWHHVTECHKKTDLQSSRDAPILGDLRFCVSSIDSIFPSYDALGRERLGRRSHFRPTGAFESGSDSHMIYSASDELDEILSRREEGDYSYFESVGESDDPWVGYCKCLEQLAKKQPEYLDAYAHLVGAYLELEDYEQAIKIGATAYEAAVALVPENFAGYVSYYEILNRGFHRLGYNLMLAFIHVGKRKDASRIKRQFLLWWPSDNLGFRLIDIRRRPSSDQY